MRGIGRASHPQGTAPPLASLNPGLSSGGPSGRIGYTFVNRFRLDIRSIAERRWAFWRLGRGGAKDFSFFPPLGKLISGRQLCFPPLGKLISGRRRHLLFGGS